MNAIVYFLIPFVSVVLMIIGYAWKDYTSMIVGGLLMFLYGFDVLVNPIVDLTAFTNVLYGSCLFAFGAYILIRSSIDLIGSYEKDDD